MHKLVIRALWTASALRMYVLNAMGVTTACCVVRWRPPHYWRAQRLNENLSEKKARRHAASRYPPEALKALVSDKLRQHLLKITLESLEGRRAELHVDIGTCSPAFLEAAAVAIKRRFLHFCKMWSPLEHAIKAFKPLCSFEPSYSQGFRPQRHTAVPARSDWKRRRYLQADTCALMASKTCPQSGIRLNHPLPPPPP